MIFTFVVSKKDTMFGEYQTDIPTNHNFTRDICEWYSFMQGLDEWLPENESILELDGIKQILADKQDVGFLLGPTAVVNGRVISNLDIKRERFRDDLDIKQFIQALSAPLIYRIVKVTPSVDLGAYQPGTEPVVYNYYIRYAVGAN